MQALLGMPDTKILNIAATAYNTNTAIAQGTGCEQQYTNKRYETGRPER